MHHNSASPPTRPRRRWLRASTAMLIELQKREDAFCFECLPTTELPPHQTQDHYPVAAAAAAAAASGKTHSNRRRTEEEKVE